MTPDFGEFGSDNRLLWVNRGTNAAPTSGQTTPYTLFSYDSEGRVTYRERRYDSGLLRGYTFEWDGSNRLRSVKEGANTRFTASYAGSGLRVGKWDDWTGSHNYSWGPGGVLFDSNGSTTHTPGTSLRSNGTDCFCHGDWQGSARYFTDSSGNTVLAALRHDAYGQRARAAAPRPPASSSMGPRPAIRRSPTAAPIRASG
jgi:hypothetical protein